MVCVWFCQVVQMKALCIKMAHILFFHFFLPSRRPTYEVMYVAFYSEGGFHSKLVLLSSLTFFLASWCTCRCLYFGLGMKRHEPYQILFFITFTMSAFTDIGDVFCGRCRRQPHPARPDQAAVTERGAIPSPLTLRLQHFGNPGAQQQRGQHRRPQGTYREAQR